MKELRGESSHERVKGGGGGGKSSHERVKGTCKEAIHGRGKLDARGTMTTLPQITFKAY